MLEKKHKKIGKGLKIDIIVIILLSVLILDMQLFGIFGRTTFLQDQAIIFEGSYRITQGQMPYQDFFIPLGPVVFYMQAFFNLIFGNNIVSMAIHSFFLSIIICMPFYFIVRKEFGIIISSIFTFFLYLSFEGLSFHALYNYSTYFFLLLNIFILLAYRKKDSLPRYVYLISALLASLDFYTKQDTGLLHFSLLFFYFIYNYRKDWKSIFLYYILPSLIFIIGTYLLLSNITGFSYWFNLGQPPHNSRLSDFLNPEEIANIFASWKIYFIIPLTILILFGKLKDREKRKILTLFLVFSNCNYNQQYLLRINKTAFCNRNTYYDIFTLDINKGLFI